LRALISLHTNSMFKAKNDRDAADFDKDIGFVWRIEDGDRRAPLNLQIDQRFESALDRKRTHYPHYSI